MKKIMITMDEETHKAAKTLAIIEQTTITDLVISSLRYLNHDDNVLSKELILLDSRERTWEKRRRNGLRKPKT